MTMKNSYGGGRVTSAQEPNLSGAEVYFRSEFLCKHLPLTVVTGDKRAALELNDGTTSALWKPASDTQSKQVVDLSIIVNCKQQLYWFQNVPVDISLAVVWQR